MMTVFKNFALEESGASAAEYALILAVVAGGIVATASFLGDEIACAVADAGADVLSGTGRTATLDGTAAPTGC